MVSTVCLSVERHFSNPLGFLYSPEVKEIQKQVVKQYCGLTFEDNSSFREHLKERELEPCCACDYAEVLSRSFEFKMTP